jgi:hypothetical protein
MQIDKEITLLNAAQIAEAMGVNYRHILTMKRAGLPMPGNRATISEVLKWRRENPNYIKQDA